MTTKTATKPARAAGWLPPHQRVYEGKRWAETNNVPRSEPDIGPDGKLDFEDMTIGDRIRYLREQRSMQQVDLAHRAGITQAAVSNLEANMLTPGGVDGKRMLRRPRGETLVSIARELATTTHWLMEGKGDPVKGVTTVSSPAEEVKKIFEGLSPEKQKAILAMVKAMV